MHIFEKKSLKMTTLRVVFNAGSLYEKEGRFGTMHLMEHLICKSFDDMLDELTKKNIKWNASTGAEYVSFYWTGLDSQLTPELKEELVRRVLAIGCKTNVTDESFEKEKATVLQEYRDCFDSPQNAVLLNTLRQKFNFYDAIGRYNDIEAFTIKDYEEVRKEFFSNPARIIEIGPRKSDLSFVKFEESRHEFAKLKYKDKWNYDFEEVGSSEKSLVQVIGKKLVKKSDYPFLKVALEMLNSGLESPLYKEIREKRGLSYYSIASLMTLLSDSVCIFYAATSKEKADELGSVYDNFFKDVTKYLTKERFDDIMNAYAIAKEEQKILRYSHISDLVRKGDVDMPKNLKKITYERVVEVAEKYLNDNNLKTIIG